MKHFDHKNIVKLLGVCTRGEPVYAVMEFMLNGMCAGYLHVLSSKPSSPCDEF